MNNIPFCKSSIGEEEKKAICDVIDTGWVVMGRKTQEFEQQFAEYVGSKFAIFVDSGTSALDLSVKRLLDKGFWVKGQEINVPSLTFTATAEVLVHNGLIPKFVDVNKQTFCIEDQGNIRQLPVHLLGNRSTAHALIYDSAHRIIKDDVKDSTALWCYSLYATKNMTTIQGGMIALNNEEDYLWLKKARDHGISKGTTERYKDGDCLYSIEFCGWREKSDDIHAAVGIEQLKKLPYMDAERRRIIARYNNNLGLNRDGLHLYPIFVENRKEFLKFMKENGVQCSVHFLPLHKMPAYKEFEVDLPITEYIGENIVSLPLFPQLTYEEIDYICEKVIGSKLFKHE
jgi:perosamine synthetase